MPELLDDSLKVEEGFEIPDDAKPEVPIPYAVKSEESREGSVLALTLEVAIDEFHKRQAGAMKELRKNTVLPGFRKGKAPEALLRRRFGKELEADAVREIAPNIFNHYALEKKLRLASEAAMEDYALDEKSLAIDFVAEILPEVKLVQYKGLEAECEYEEQTGDAAEAEIERFREIFAEHKAVDGKALDADGAATLNVSARDERGKVDPRRSGDGRFFRKLSAELPDEIVAALNGKKAGDKVSVSVDAERKGTHGNVFSKKDSYDIEVVAVHEWSRPAVDDAWIKENLGFEEGLDAFRAKVRERAEKERSEHKQAHALGALFDALAEKNPFDVPKSLVQRRFWALYDEEVERLAMYMGKRGKRLELSDRHQEILAHVAKKDVTRAFLTGTIARELSIQVTDEELDQEIATRAEAEGRKPLAVRAELERHRRLNDLKEYMLRKKVETMLLDENKVNFVAPKPAEESEAAKA